MLVINIALTVVAACSILASTFVCYVTVTDSLLSRLRGLRQVAMLAVFDVLSSLQFLFVLSSFAKDSHEFCVAEAVQTQLSFILWLGVHTTLAFGIMTEMGSEQSRSLPFMNEWLSLAGVTALAVLTIMWMLLPCESAIQPLAYSDDALCWMRDDSAYSCRLLLFDIPCHFAVLVNLYVLISAARLESSKQLPWARTLRSYTMSYSIVFLLEFAPYIAGFWYSKSAGFAADNLPSVLNYLILFVWASHGLLNSAVFLPLWYGVSHTKALLGGYTTLPRDLEISHLRRLQEWERLVQSLTGLMASSSSAMRFSRVSPASSGTYRAPQRATFQNYRMSSALLRSQSFLASALESSASHIRSVSPPAGESGSSTLLPDTGSFDSIFPTDSSSVSLARARYRSLFSYEKLSVFGAESVPLLGPHLLVHQGLLMFRIHETSGSSTPLPFTGSLFAEDGAETSTSAAVATASSVGADHRRDSPADLRVRAIASSLPRSSHRTASSSSILAQSGSATDLTLDLDGPGPDTPPPSSPSLFSSITPTPAAASKPFVPYMFRLASDTLYYYLPSSAPGGGTGAGGGTSFSNSPRDQQSLLSTVRGLQPAEMTSMIRNTDLAGTIPLSSAVIAPAWNTLGDLPPSVGGTPYAPDEYVIQVITEEALIELKATTAEDAHVWLHKLRHLDPSGIQHVETLLEDGTPVLNLGGPTGAVCIARYPLGTSRATSWMEDDASGKIVRSYLDYMNLALASNFEIASRLAAEPDMYPISFSPSTFLLEIIGLHSVDAIGYSVQESISLQVERMLSEHNLEGFSEEFTMHPVHGWGEDGYGARNYVALSLADLATLRKDTSFLSSLGLVGYAVSIHVIFVSGWARLDVATRAAVTAHFARLRAIPQSFDIGKFVIIRIKDFLPGTSRVPSALYRVFPFLSAAHAQSPQNYQELFMNKIAVEVQSPESRMSNAAASSSSFFASSFGPAASPPTPPNPDNGGPSGLHVSIGSSTSNPFLVRESTPLLADERSSSQTLSALAALSGVAQPRTVVDFLSRPGSAVDYDVLSDGPGMGTGGGAPYSSTESGPGHAGGVSASPTLPYIDLPGAASPENSFLRGDRFQFQAGKNTSLHASVPTLAPLPSPHHYSAAGSGGEGEGGTPWWRVHVSAAWCVMCMIMGGSLYLFPLYGPHLCEVHGISSNSDTLILAALYIIGFYFALPTGILYARFGPRITLISSSGFFAIGHILLYLGTIRMFSFSSPWSLGCVYLVVGVGANGLLISSVAILLNAYPLSAALAAGFLMGVTASGCIAFGALYTYVFNESLHVFFLTLAIIGVILVLGTLIIVPSDWEGIFGEASQRRLSAILAYSKSSPWLISRLISSFRSEPDAEPRPNTLGLAGSPPHGHPERLSASQTPELEEHQASKLIAAALDHMDHTVTGLDLLLHPEFVCLAVIVALVQGTSELVSSYIVNLEDNTEVSQVFLRLVLIFLGRALGAFLMGGFCTLFTPPNTPIRYSKPYSYWPVGVCLLVSMSHLLLTRNDTTLIQSGLFCAGLLYGVLDVTFLMLLQKFFGAMNIALNYAILTSFQATSSLLLQIYSQREVNSSCYGAKCFTNLFLIASTCCFLAAGCSLFLWRLRARDRVRRSKVVRTVAAATRGGRH